MAVETVGSIVDPQSPDYLFDHVEPQMLVDTAIRIRWVNLIYLPEACTLFNRIAGPGISG